MRGSLSDSPLLRITIMMMVGIAVGRQIGSPASLWGIAVLVLLLCSVLLRRWEKVASVLLLAMAFSLGTFLIKYPPSPTLGGMSGTHQSTDSSFVQEISQWMDKERAQLSHVYQTEGLQGDDYGIVAAMTLGEKERVSDELRDVYSISGAAHVFALSGMHLGIIFMLLAYILPMTRFPKTCTMVQIVTLWTYVMLVGFHASVIRAAVMLTVYAFGRVVSRHPDNITVLIFTVALLLVVAPQWLFNVGFQMSFMAVLSICLCYSKLFRMALPEHREKKYKKPSRWKKCLRAVGVWAWGLFALSLTAQMGVAPLVAHYFGRFSCYSLLTNYIVSPAALIVIALALLLFVCVAIASVLPWLAFLATGVTFLLTGVVRLLNGFLLMITKMPYASVEGIQLNVIQTVLVYVIIICLWRIVLILRCRYGFGRKL